MVESKKDDDQVIFKDFRYNNQYLVDFTSKDVNLKICLFTKTLLGCHWHRRLAHVGMSSLKKLIKNELVRGLKDVKFEKDKFVVHVKPASKLQTLIQPKLTCQQQEC